MFNHIHHDFPKLTRAEIDGSRVYLTPEGLHYPSVTTVLSEYSKKGITQWRKKVGEDQANAISRHASTRGTSLHFLAEKYLQNETVPFADADMFAKTLYTRIKPELNKINNIQCQEVPLYSDKLGLAGTPDCIAEYDGVLSTIDFKSSSKPKRESWIQNYFMQGAAYSQMFEEHTGIKVPQIVIIVGVDTENHAQVFKTTPEEHMNALRYYINLYKEKQK